MTNQEAAEMIRNDMKLHHDYLSGQYRKALNMAVNALLKEQPEIVLCKDCKWYKEGYNIDGKWFSRCNGSARTYGRTEPDWFCADGERKEGQ